MSFLMHMDSEMFADLVLKAIEKDVEEKIWDKWLVELPYMEKQLTFEEYKRKHYVTDTSTDKTDEEILQDAENILKMMNKPK